MPRSKQRSTREAPEGNSIMQKKSYKMAMSPKVKGKPSNNTVPKSHKAGKKPKVQEELSEDEFDVDESFGSASESSGAESEEEMPMPQRAPVAKKQKNDSVWEEAVQTARGLPDGASRDNIDAVDDDDEEEEEDAEPTESKENIEVKSDSGKKSKEKKSKNKLAAAASKTLKKIKEAGNKRKGPQAKEGEAKKLKLEEMSWTDRRKIRRQSKMNDNYEIISKAKVLWNEMRRMDLTKERRHQLSTELYRLVQGKAPTLVMAHDTSRVFQCLMKYGSQEHKNAIFEELKDHLGVMAKSKYAKFFVRRSLKYGTKEQRAAVFKVLAAKTPVLIKHKVAAELVECFYNDYATAPQRQLILEQFYGPTFAVFKTPELTTFEEIVEQQPEKKEVILRSMHSTLNSLIDKTILQYSLVHRVFLEYLTHTTPKLQTEMIEHLRDGVIHMLHTRDGSRVAMHCLWNGTAKDRKSIIKSMKTYVLKICKEEYGHMVMLALFDSVDDTKLVQKVILEEMLKNVNEVAEDQYGRKVLLYLLCPRDPKHFHPDIVKVLRLGDGNQTSKKDAAVRSAELLESVSKPLVQYLTKHCATLATNNAALLLILSILKHTKSDPTDAYRAMSELVAKPFTVNQTPKHMVEEPAGHLTLKQLLAHDKERAGQGEQVLFCNILMDIVPKGQLKTWAACNRGCFMLTFLLEVGVPEVSTRVKSELKDIKKSIEKLQMKGAQILLQKLSR